MAYAGAVGGASVEPRRREDAVEFRILGPLEAADDEGAVALGPTKQRALLAVLLLHRRGRSQRAADRGALGRRAPATAAKSVQVYVSQLRKALDERLVTRGGGYVLELEPGSLDLDRFQALAGDGQQLLAQGDANRAAELLRAAPAHGPAAVDFRYEPFAQTEIQRLEELRLAASRGPDRGGSRARPAHDTRRRGRGACPGAPATRERLRAQLMLYRVRAGRARRRELPARARITRRRAWDRARPEASGTSARS